MWIRKDQILALSGGEYSDYYVKGHFKVLKDFHVNEECERFKKEGPYIVKQYEWAKEVTEHGSDDRFVTWLQTEGFIDPLEEGILVEVHCGSYGRLSIS